MQLAIAMVTAPRPEPYVAQALSSLRDAGFDQLVRLFMEPDCPPVAMDRVAPYLAAVPRGCYGNWRLALSCTMQQEDADWYLMLQDDVIWCRGGRTLVEAFMARADLEDFGFASPYASPAMVPFTKQDDHQVFGWSGWTAPDFYDNAFWGALALLFTRESARALLRFPRFLEHDHHRKLDVLVGNCMRDMGRTMFVSVPSLCDHIGRHSTLGRHKIKGIQWARRGFAFDPAWEGRRECVLHDGDQAGAGNAGQAGDCRLLPSDASVP